jgi:predicted PurR-regulated permease PerM
MIRYATLISFACVVIFAVWVGRGVLLPFVVALFLVYVVSPVVRWLAAQEVRGRAVPRWAAVLTVYAGIVGVIWVFSVAGLPALLKEMAKLVKDAPSFFNTVRTEWVPWLNTRLQVVLVQLFPPESGGIAPVLDLNEQVSAALQQAAEWVLSHIADALKLGQTLVTGIIGAFVGVVLTLMIAAFLLIDLRQIHSFFRSMVPEGYADRYDDLLARMDRGLSGVIRGQLLICLINGILTFIGLRVLGVPFTLLLALVAGTLSLIPIFGTILSTIPAVAIGLTVSFVTGASVLGWILLIHFVEANFLNPKIIGTSAKIHPVIVIFALLVGEHSFGLIGALVAVPIASIIQTLFLFVRSLSATEA